MANSTTKNQIIADLYLKVHSLVVNGGDKSTTTDIQSYNSFQEIALLKLFDDDVQKLVREINGFILGEFIVYNRSRRKIESLNYYIESFNSPTRQPESKRDPYFLTDVSEKVEFAKSIKEYLIESFTKSDIPLLGEIIRGTKIEKKVVLLPIQLSDSKALIYNAFANDEWISIVSDNNKNVLIEEKKNDQLRSYLEIVKKSITPVHQGKELILSYIPAAFQTFEPPFNFFGLFEIDVKRLAEFKSGITEISRSISIIYSQIIGILAERRRLEVKNEAIKSAIAAIMARNLSHNIGSHVITNTKAQLDQLALNHNNLQPKLSGLSRLLHYIQERQDFIAVLASGEQYTKGPVNVKEHIFDFLAYDGPAIRHGSKYNFNNYLLDNIIRSENITRGAAPGLRSLEIELILKEGRNVYKLKSLSRDSITSAKLSTINLAIPYGMNGRQAFLTILENFIRNSAKHLQKSIPNEGLVVSIVLEKLDNKKNGLDNSQKYNILIHDNKGHFDEVIKNINSTEKIIEVCLKDEKRFIIKPKSLKILNIGDQSKPDPKHKGLKEMLICLAWMKGMSDYSVIEDNPSEKLGIHFVRTENDSFAISFELECFENVIMLISDQSKRAIGSNEIVVHKYSESLFAKAYEINDIESSSNKNVIEFIKELPSAEMYILDDGGEKLRTLQKHLPRVVPEADYNEVKDYFAKTLCGLKGLNPELLESVLVAKNSTALAAYYYFKSFEHNTKLLGVDVNVFFQYKLVVLDRFIGINEIISEIERHALIQAKLLKFVNDQSLESDKEQQSYKKKERDLRSQIENLMPGDPKNYTHTIDEFVKQVLPMTAQSEKSLENLCVDNCILFKHHYETFDHDRDFMPQLPGKCKYIEGISGANYTNTLIRNSEYTFKHYAKVTESCFTKIAIIDERLFLKFKNPPKEYNTPSDWLSKLSLEDFTSFFRERKDKQELYNFESYRDLLKKYAEVYNIFLDKNSMKPSSHQLSKFDNKLTYFNNNENIFLNFLKFYFDVNKKDIRRLSWGNYFKGKNVGVYNISQIKKHKTQTDEIEFVSIFKPEKTIPIDELFNYHFISIHYGLLEKIADHFIRKDNSENKSPELIEVLKDLFKGYRGKLSIHSGRGDLHKIKDSSVTFIPLSGIEWSLENSKFMLTELFYNQKYYPLD